MKQPQKYFQVTDKGFINIYINGVKQTDTLFNCKGVVDILIEEGFKQLNKNIKKQLV